MTKLYETLSKRSAGELEQIIAESAKILEARREAEAVILAEQTKRYISAYRKAIKEDRLALAEKYADRINTNKQKLEELGFLAGASEQ